MDNLISFSGRKQPSHAPSAPSLVLEPAMMALVEQCAGSEALPAGALQQVLDSRKRCFRAFDLWIDFESSILAGLTVERLARSTASAAMVQPEVELALAWRAVRRSATGEDAYGEVARFTAAWDHHFRSEEEERDTLARKALAKAGLKHVPVECFLEAVNDFNFHASLAEAERSA